MSTISRLLAANRPHAASFAPLPGPQPARRLMVVTCMDTRIDPLGALGLELGDAQVLRNAGARVTEDVLRSLALSTHLFGVDTVVLLQHTGCGLLGVTDDELRRITGADLQFGAISDHASALGEDLRRLADTPYLAGLQAIAGLVYDVATGRVDEVTGWERAGHA